MAQVDLWGATYNNVPAINVPSGNGTARFTDTSDATATSDKILQGYTAYGADGSKLTGTATGGGGSVTQDQDGFIVLPPDGGGSPSVGGLEYETGTWIPTEDIAKPTISFSGSHTNVPMTIILSDATGTSDSQTYTNYGFSFTSFHSFTGNAVPSTDTSSCRYGLVNYVYRGSSSGTSQVVTALTGLSGTTSVYSQEHWVTTSGFSPNTDSDSRYWRTNRTYQWIAVWAPTT